MTKYGEEYRLNEEEMENIASYMNDEIREDLISKWLLASRKNF
ncbi:hypothetical protein [Blautia sp. AM47-4]|nr:hypothetical protein [Blautia sp. AM47-4]